MNQVDKISKETLNLLEYSKDVVKENLTTANVTGQLEPKLSDEHLKKVLHLVDVSMSQGYQKAIQSFQRNISTVLSTHEDVRSHDTSSRKKK
jgi:hypothetical protein